MVSDDSKTVSDNGKRTLAVLKVDSGGLYKDNLLY